MKYVLKSGDKIPLDNGIWNVIWSAYWIEVPYSKPLIMSTWKKLDVRKFNVEIGIKGVNMHMSIKIKDGAIVNYWNDSKTSAMNQEAFLLHVDNRRKSQLDADIERMSDLTKRAIEKIPTTEQVQEMFDENAAITEVLRLMSLDKSEDTAQQCTAILLSGKLGVKPVIRMPFAKPEQIIVGAKFWYNCTDSGSLAIDIRLMEVTHIRSGIVFYIDDVNSEERSFPLGCLMAARLEPEVHVHGMNPEWYDFTSQFGKSKFKYVKAKLVTETSSANEYN
jgi:hypothetical protein